MLHSGNDQRTREQPVENDVVEERERRGMRSKKPACSAEKVPHKTKQAPAVPPIDDAPEQADEEDAYGPPTEPPVPVSAAIRELASADVEELRRRMHNEVVALKHMLEVTQFLCSIDYAWMRVSHGCTM